MRPATPDEPDRRDAFTKLEQAFDRAEEVSSGASSGVDPPLNAAGRRRAAAFALAFALAVAVLAGAFAYAGSLLAVDRAATHTDERVAVLESDLQQRRATAAEQNANRDQQIAELRRLVCLFADHSQPRDAAVEDVRRDYGCIPQPTPKPTR